VLGRQMKYKVSLLISARDGVQGEVALWQRPDAGFFRQRTRRLRYSQSQRTPQEQRTARKPDEGNLLTPDEHFTQKREGK